MKYFSLCLNLVMKLGLFWNFLYVVCSLFSVWISVLVMNMLLYGLKWLWLLGRLYMVFFLIGWCVCFGGCIGLYYLVFVVCIVCMNVVIWVWFFMFFVFFILMLFEILIVNGCSWWIVLLMFCVFKLLFKMVWCVSFVGIRD